MAIRFVAAASGKNFLRLASSAFASVWAYALVLFMVGSGFTILATFSTRLVPAVFVACLLGGLLASLKVWVRGRE